MSTDYKKVAEILRERGLYGRGDINIAIDHALPLIDLASKLPPGEAERWLEFQIHRQQIQADIARQENAMRECVIPAGHFANCGCPGMERPRKSAKPRRPK